MAANPQPAPESIALKRAKAAAEKRTAEANRWREEVASRAANPDPEHREYLLDIPCLECWQRFSTEITFSHLRKDGLDGFKEYRTKHPDAPLSVVGEVARRVGIPIPKLWKWRAAGNIPPPDPILGWDLTTIREYRDRFRMRDPGGLRIPCLECPVELGPKRLFAVITPGHLRKHFPIGDPCEQYSAKHPDASFSAWAHLVRQSGVSDPTLRKWFKEGKVLSFREANHDLDVIIAAILKYKETGGFGKQDYAERPERGLAVSQFHKNRWKKVKADLAKLAKAEHTTTASEKLANPSVVGNMWMSPKEVARALGIGESTFYKRFKDGHYRRLTKNKATGWYLTTSVLEQLRMK